MIKTEIYLLHDARKTQKHITVYLVNGFQLRGTISSFDDVCIELVDEEGNRKLVYKHAISTINL